MSPSVCSCGLARLRTAVEVNADIRRLVDAGGPWDADRYGQLLEEWAAVRCGEYVEAA